MSQKRSQVAADDPKIFRSSGDPRAIRSHLESKGEALLVGFGGSMEPTISSGERIRLVPPDRLRRGSIVTFAWNGSIVTHRIVWIAGGWLWARGDACLSLEGPLKPDAVLGLAVGVERRGVWQDLGEENLREQLWNATHLLLRGLGRGHPAIRRALARVAVSRPARLFLKRVRARLYGKVTVREERDPTLVFGAAAEEPLLAAPLPGDTSRYAEVVRLFVAEDERKRLGRALLLRAEVVESWGVITRTVTPTARGMGIGRCLLERAIAEAREQRLYRIVFFKPGGTSDELPVALADWLRSVAPVDCSFHIYRSPDIPIT